MFHPLAASQRRRLLRWSVAACATCVLLLPLAARPGADLSGSAALRSEPPAVPDVPVQLRYPKLDVARDPFDRPVEQALTDDGIDPGLVLPPNAGIASTPTVRGVVLGVAPKALVELNGRTVIVGIGSKLGALTVVGVTPEGVELDDGSRLPIDTARP